MNLFRHGLHILFAVAAGLGVAIGLFLGILVIISPPTPISTDKTEAARAASDTSASHGSPRREVSFDLETAESFRGCVESHNDGDMQTPKEMTDAVRACSEERATTKVEPVVQKQETEIPVVAESKQAIPCESPGAIPYFCNLSAQPFIQLIYLLQFCALWIEASIVIYLLPARLFKIHMPADHPDHFLGAAVRWAIDTPPVLGVVGTLYAFSVAAAVDAGGGSALRLSDVFRSSFEDAVVTTMIGGLVYVANLGLNILKDSNVKVS